MRTEQVKYKKKPAQVTGYAVIGTSVFEMYDNNAMYRIADFYARGKSPLEFVKASAAAHDHAEVLRQRMAFA